MHVCQPVQFFTDEKFPIHTIFTLEYLFTVKTPSLFLDLNGKLISNIFSGMKMDFRFLKK